MAITNYHLEDFSLQVDLRGQFVYLAREDPLLSHQPHPAVSVWLYGVRLDFKINVSIFYLVLIISPAFFSLV